MEAHRVIGLALAVVVAWVVCVSAQHIQVLQTYYVPITEEQCYSAMRAIAEGSALPLPPTNLMFSAWGIVASETNTIVVYDHWEDGYEADISSPTQSTTQIWGDNNPTNGIPPGFSMDLLYGGSYISLTNTLSVPRNISELRYDGRDKILATKPIATARAQYAVNPGQVLAGAAQAPDISRYGTEFVAPVGTNTLADQAFEYCGLTVIAAYDGTLVNFDINADGTNDIQVWLDEGEVYMVTNIMAGTRVTASGPVQAHLLTGDVGSTYRMRWYMLFPSYQWDTEYLASAGSRTNADGGVTFVDIHFYNPNSSSITVFCQTLTGTASVVIGPRSNGVYRMPFESGGRFYTTNNMKFLGLAVCDAVEQSREWGFSLIPSKVLTTAALCGWGQGSGDLSQNANPLWVSVAQPTTIYVDWDSNPETGPLTDPYGRRCNAVTTLAAFAMATLYDDSGDNDQGGMRVYSYSNRIATVWGEDPRMSHPGNPYLDMGCEILALPTVMAEKKHVLIVDNNTNGIADPGDTIRYTIRVQNIGWVVANNVVVMDVIPPNCTYITNSTATNGVPIPDDPPPATPFRLDGSGLFWGTLPVGATGSVSYSVRINSPYPSTGDLAVANSAFVSSSIGGGGVQDPRPVNQGNLLITKTAVPTNRVHAGSNVLYTITIRNTGSVAQTMVRIGDLLPPGMTYVPGSATGFSSVLSSTTIIYAASGTFTPPAGITSVIVEAWGGGGGGATRTSNGAGGGGGGGAYSRSTVTVIPGSNYTVNVGAGGGATVSGGSSWFALGTVTSVLAVGGSGAPSNSAAGAAGGSAASGIGDVRYSGGNGANGVAGSYGGGGGSSAGTNAAGNSATGSAGAIAPAGGGNGGDGRVAPQGNGSPGSVPGGGGGGALRTSNLNRLGGNGANGQVFITYYFPTPVTVAPYPVFTSNLTLSAGETVTITFLAQVTAPITAAQFVNTAWVASAQNPGRLYAYVTNYPPHADLAVFKSVNNATPNTNDLITFTVVITNLGPDHATNVVVYDLLPSGITFVTNSLSQGVYSGLTGIWTVGTVNASGAATLWITGRVNGGTGGQTITNTARITGSSLVDPNTANNTSSVSITVQLADLVVSKSVDNPAPSPGDVVTFTIVVSNVGPNAATGVTIYDPVPTGLSYVSAAPSSGTYNNVSGVWTVGTIQVGASVTLALTASVDLGTDDTVITNLARVLSLNQQEVSLLNNTGLAYVAVAGLDIGVSKIADNYEPNTNEAIIFTITVTNFGPSAYSAFTLNDLMPTGLVYLGHEADMGYYDPVSGDWTIEGLAMGATATLTIKVAVDGGAGGWVITNTAYLSWVKPSDYNPNNNVSSAVIRVQSADLSIGKSASQSLANSNDVVSFTVWLTNRGPSAATGIVVTDAVPSGVAYLGYSASHGTYNPTNARWTIPTLASGAVASLTLNVRITAPVGSAVTNRAAILGSQQYDPSSVNHSAAVTVTVINARLVMTKSSSSTNGEPVLYFSDAVEYTVFVTNAGNVLQTGLTVRDPVPTGGVYVAGSTWITAPRHTTNTVHDRFTFQSYSDNYGTTNWIVNWDEAGTDDESPATGNIRILTGNLRIDNTGRVVRRMADLQGATNAILSFLWRRDGLDDTNDFVAVEVSSNGYGGTWVEVGRVAGPGTETVFTSTTINISAFISSNLALRFRSSATLGIADYVYVDDVRITWYGRYVVTWPGTPPDAVAQNFELHPGETMTVRYQVRVQEPTTVTQLINVASVTSAQHQAVLQASTTNEVARSDLIVGKTVNNETPTVGATIDYTIVVSNAGPNKAKGVQLTDYLPPSCVTFSNATVSQGTFNTNTLVWDVGTINAGSSATLTLRAVVEFNDACAGLWLTNRATVTGRKQIEVTTTNDTGIAVIRPRPTQVVISRFEGQVVDGRVVLEWETASEAGTIGFYVYRSADGKTYEKVKDALLPAVLTSPAGGRYRLVDRGAEVGERYWYRVEEVEAWGTRNWHGPYEVRTLNNARGVKTASGRVEEEDYQWEAKGVSLEKAERLAGMSEVGTGRQIRGVRQGPPPANEVKVIVKETGVYAVEATELAGLLGLTADRVRELVRTYNVSLWNRGNPVRYVATASGNRLYFYGEGIESVYTDENVYWVRAGRSAAPEVVEGRMPVGAPSNLTYRERRKVEKAEVAATALFRRDDSDYWMWAYLIAGHPTLGVRTIEVASEERAPVGRAQLEVELQGGSASGVANEHHAVVHVNGVYAGEARWTGLLAHTVRVEVAAGVLSNGQNTVRVEARLNAGVPYGVIYLNRVRLAYDRYYTARGDHCVVEAGRNVVVTLRGFTNEVINVLEVTDPRRIRVVRGLRIERQADGRYMASFQGGGKNYTPRYAGFTWHGAKRPVRLEGARVVGLTADTNRADIVLITVPALRTGAEQLANYRRSQGYEVRVVELQDVYDAFSHGLKVPEGIQEFLRYAYRYWDREPSYAVLVGEGTFDHQNVMGIGDNLIGPKMVGTPHGIYESDTWFGDVVGDDGVMEVVVGRLPVVNTNELRVLVDKIVAYESGSGAGWAQRVVLVADDPDEGGEFPTDSEAIGALVPDGYTKERIYLNMLPLSQARARLRAAVTNGAVWVNYIGHAGMDRLAQEGVMLSSDVGALVNWNRNPVLTALTCLVGRYGVPGNDCLGELLVLRANAGMVAVWAPSGLSMNQQARKLGQGFAWACFQDRVPTVGEMVLQAAEDYRAAGEPVYMLRIYNLLGDPALRVK